MLSYSLEYYFQQLFSYTVSVCLYVNVTTNDMTQVTDILYHKKLYRVQPIAMNKKQIHNVSNDIYRLHW
jgi:hypothetical protein